MKTQEELQKLALLEAQAGIDPRHRLKLQMLFGLIANAVTNDPTEAHDAYTEQTAFDHSVKVHGGHRSRGSSAAFAARIREAHAKLRGGR